MAKVLKNIEDLTIAFLSDGLTSQEEAAMRLLLKDPDNRNYFRKMYMIWHAGKNVKKSEDVERALQKALCRISSPERRHKETGAPVRHFPFRRVAAAVALVAGIALYLVMNTGKSVDRNATVPVSVSDPVPAIQVTKVTVPLGATSTVELSDGTTVTLNAGSSFRYDASFGKDSREVQLEGEGYFKVARDEALPFVVRVKDVTIRALGTEFNITAYPEEKTVRTTLVNGSVSIRKDGDHPDEKELILKPSQTVTVFKHTPGTISAENTLQPLKRKQVTAQVTENAGKDEVLLEESVKKTLLYTSWKDPRWIIEAEPLEDLVVKLQRRYNVRIFIVDEALRKYPFNGIFTDETLEQVLEIMKAAIPLKYAINKKDILLSTDRQQYEIFEKSKKLKK
ncbi:MAG: FecR domain-containing protein [Bacteroidales bacterium]|jgi:ferric-dicitrate binding protein FerR (iron transport regulator)|nr:FecR domain-containing protein [Bacteroidales bacterium]